MKDKILSFINLYFANDSVFFLNLCCKLFLINFLFQF